MEYRRLGRAGIKLSAIGLGNWLTHGHGVDDATARSCIRRAFELGVNFFDTADAYARGAAETVYGRELSGFRRRDLVIATKCYFPFSDGVNDRGLSRKHIFESIHDSLKRLRTDYVDLFQCHRYDDEVGLEEVVRAMDDVVRQGKALYWGVSQWSAGQIEEACALAEHMNACPPASNQPEYSLAARRVEVDGVQRACRELGLGMVVYSPLAQGVLSGKYSGGKVPRDARAGSDRMNAFLKTVDARLAERVDRLRPIAERRGVTLAQLALGWLVQRAGVTSVICGATRVAQIEENVAAVDVALEDDDLKAIDALFPAEDDA